MLLRRWFSMALAGVCLGLVATAAWAQVSSPNLPPSGGYQAIPNYSGPGAGLQFRSAINDRFDGSAAISPKFVGLSFSNLPAEQDGLLLYCADCQQTIPCSGGGSGAWAFGESGQWTCTAPNAPAGVLYSGASDATGSLGLNALTGAGTTPSLSRFSVNGVVNVKAYGAVGDAISGTDGTTAASSTTFSSAGTSCTSSRVGEVINVAGAGASGANLATTISSCSGSSFVMATAASTAISGTAKWVIGHDDTSAIQAAAAAAVAKGGELFFPKTGGKANLVGPFGAGPAYLITSPINLSDAENLVVTGPGALIYPDTGGIAFDFGGDRRSTVKRMVLFEPQGLATPSTVGFYITRDTATNAKGNEPGIFPFYNTFEGNTVELLSDSSANGGHGTAAFYNCGGASNTYINNVFVGDTGLALTGSNAYGITSPFYTIQAEGISNSTFVGSNDFRSNGSGPALLLDGVSQSDFYGMHIGGIGPFTSNAGTGAGIEIEGADYDNHLNGNVEIFAWAVQIDAGAQVEHDSFDFMQGNAPSFAGGFDMLANGSTSTTVEGSSFKTTTFGSTHFYPLVENTGTTGTFTGNTVYGGPPDKASMASMTLSGASWINLGGATQNTDSGNGSSFYHLKATNIDTGSESVSGNLSATGNISAYSINLTNTGTPDTNITFGGADGNGAHTTMNQWGNIIQGSGAASGDSWGVFDTNGIEVLSVGTGGNKQVSIACSGTATLSSGSATVSNSCIATGVPIICTDNSSTSGAGCSAVPSSGSLALHGTGSDVVSWAQF